MRQYPSTILVFNIMYNQDVFSLEGLKAIPVYYSCGDAFIPFLPDHGT
jgi:hypothetical protein